VAGYIRADHVLPVTMHGSSASTDVKILRAMLNGLDMSFNFRPPRTQFIQGIEASVGVSGLSVTASILNPMPQSIVLGSLDLAVRERTSRGAPVYDVNTARSLTRIPGQVMKPGQASTLRAQLSLFDAHLGDFELLRRLIEGAKKGKVVVGVTGLVGITIKPGFSITVNYTADNISATVRCPIICPQTRKGARPLLARPLLAPVTPHRNHSS